MLTVHSYERIRHAYVVEGKSIRQIGREYGHGYWTVHKALEQSEPQPYQLSQAKDAPVLGAYKEQIEAMLVENQRLPRKQRYTSRKIYRALRETGYQGAESTVRAYVSRRRKAVRRSALYLPLVFDPGIDAQVDWGEATVMLEGDAVDLDQIPIQHCWPGDVAPLVTWGLTITRGPYKKRQNLGIYRQQKIGKNKLIMRWLDHRGGAIDFREWQEAHPGERFPVAVALGADPATILGAVTPVPDSLSEYAFAGLLRGSRTELVNTAVGEGEWRLQVPASAEIVLEGHIPTAINSPDGVTANLKNPPSKDKYLVLYCHGGMKSPAAGEKMRADGYKHVFVWGGIVSWPYARDTSSK